MLFRSLLAFYGLHRYVMIFLYYRHRKDKPVPQSHFTELPRITIQLPLYNEKYVVNRLLETVAKLDYPADKLEIQVLDDSTDDTAAIAERKVAELRQRGCNIQFIHRTNREGFKAGALQNGLLTATGEYIAIFDADFVPQQDLLHQTIHYFTDSKVGMLQTRWGHLNDHYSLLTRVQSIFLDGHFLIEQTARSRSGRFFNFNGTAGIWRRSCIEDSGGWSHDTLAEDLDLSYRAQIRGWKFLFLSDVVVPAELPVEMNAFKTQQHRWAKGSIQACKKMLPTVWRSPLSLKVKIEATAHLTSNFGYLMLVVLCLFCRAPAAATTDQVTMGNQWTKMMLVDLPLFLAATVSVIAFYICAQRELHDKWWKRLAYVPLMMAVGIGLSVNNARAVLEAIFNHKSEFIRTPKYGVATGGRSAYQALRGLIPLIELGMAVYFSFLIGEAISRDEWSVLPFIIVIAGGFSYVGILSLMQGRFTKPAPVPLAPVEA